MIKVTAEHLGNKIPLKYPCLVHHHTSSPGRVVLMLEPGKGVYLHDTIKVCETFNTGDGDWILYKGKVTLENE